MSFSKLNAWSNFSQLEAMICKGEHTSLRGIDNLLAHFNGVGTIEGDMFHLSLQTSGNWPMGLRGICPIAFWRS
ncbi:hypothetical protein [Desulforhopalus sp. IMCC35007]|uniref:hypothetical protein n=1 Tax=Desulforhopalus sp. IMCC35007 TaxID=2569543 RepID=UPI0010ADB705|nr:hypothetical protein [Desulforhopalus sp. IMCC35007]TKB08407.1 hypothetical protein FCL48_13820 [Desulforhopalus sp. IMCC35007]